MSESKLLLAEPDLSQRQEPAARGTRPSRFRHEYAAAGHSTRSQGRDVVVAGSAGVCRRAVCPAACQVVAGLADGVAGVIVSVAMRKSPVVAN